MSGNGNENGEHAATLADGKLLVGSGAADVNRWLETGAADVIVDLRAEAADAQPETAETTGPALRLRVPLVDGVFAPSVMQEAVDTVVAHIRDGRRVAVHCAAGRSRTGSVAAGALVEMGAAASLEEAERLVQSVRPEAQIHPELKRSLEELFTGNERKHPDSNAPVFD